MQWVLGGLVILGVVAFVVGQVTGRVRARSCCAVPAEHDQRLRVPLSETSSAES